MQLSSLTKRIFTHLNLHDFLHGDSYNKLSNFFELLGSSVKGLQEIPPLPTQLAPLLEAIKEMHRLVGYNLDTKTESRYYYYYWFSN